MIFLYEIFYDKVKEYWKDYYNKDKVAFIFEFISFVFTVGASMTLATTAKAPNMALIYPFFFIGSITAVYAHYRRKLAWPTMLVSYFSIVNIFGLGVASGWW